MTRINTNVSSLTAQKTLARSQASLQLSLTRLSTGLRINAGKDDPAGLIASEALRRDMTATSAAIANSQQATQMMATADSALGQVSSLLNDIRGLVSSAANTGAMSADQIAANQLQIDSSLEAINRISQVTNFQGRRLLDGTLDFTTNNWSGDSGKVTDLQVSQANLGSLGTLGVTADVTTAATQGEIDAVAGTGVQATGTVNFKNNTGGAGWLTVQAKGAGTGFNGVTVQFVEDAGTAIDSPKASYDAQGKKLTITVSNTGVTTIADITTAVAATTPFTVSASAGTNYDASRNVPEGQQAWTDVTFADGTKLRLTANSLVGAAGNVSFNASEAVGTGGHDLPVVGWAGGALTIQLDSDSSTAMSELITAINGEGHFSAQVVTGNTAGVYNPTGADTTALFVGPTNGYNAVTGTTASGTGTGALLGNVVFQLTGARGSQVFSFSTGTTAAQIADAVNAVSDAIGVTATDTGSNLAFNSSTYGSEGLVKIDMISDTQGAFTTSLGGVTRSTGSDIVGKINGITAQGKGSTLSVNTGGLTASISFDDATSADGDSTSFNINGGGAIFQLGPDVTTAQQARIGIQSVSSATLGGSAGKLYQLGSGQGADLTQSATTAASITDQVINKVTALRGRLGAFQKASLESNIASLSDTLENLTSAQSAIRDADFAAESANLTRAQILTQSGTSVLGVANQAPQQVLALLRNL